MLDVREVFRFLANIKVNKDKTHFARSVLYIVPARSFTLCPLAFDFHLASLKNARTGHLVAFSIISEIGRVLPLVV